MLVERLSPPRVCRPEGRHTKLLGLFPDIHQSLSESSTSLLAQWRLYNRKQPHALGYSRFAQLYGEWLSTNGLSKWPHNRWTVPIGHDDYTALKAWRSSNDRRKWQRAVALLDLHKHCTMASICRKVERSTKTIKGWRRMFLTHGLAGLASAKMRNPDNKVRVKRLSPPRVRRPEGRHIRLLGLFPDIHQSLSASTTSLLAQWKLYNRKQPHALGYSRFAQLYGEWLSTNGLRRWPRHRWTVPITDDDYRVLKAWRTSNDKRKWQRAIALLDLHKHRTMKSICGKLERSANTIKRWRRMFLAGGLAGLALLSKKTVSKERLAVIAKKKERTRI